MDADSAANGYSSFYEMTPISPTGRIAAKMLNSQAKKLIAETIGDRLVLVIEPQTNYKNSIRGYLANMKLTRVRFASNTSEAHRELITNDIGLLIAEWSVGPINGLQFCRDLRVEERYQKVPFLLLTIENQRQDVILASEVGIDGYLLKPFSFEDFSNAIYTICQVISRPNLTNRLLFEADTFYKNQDLEAAYQTYAKAEAENPNSARAVCGMAKVAATRKSYKTAIDLYKKAIQTNPDYIEAHRELLEVYLVAGPATELCATAEYLNKVSPGNPRYTLVLANCYLELKDIEKSERYFKMALRLSPHLADAYKGLGNLSVLQDDYDSAMKNFGKALQLDRKDVSILNSLGLVYVRLERYKEGIEKYRAALKFIPDDPRILFNLAYAFEKNGEIDKAISQYELAIANDPEFEKARRRLEMLTQLKSS